MKKLREPNKLPCLMLGMGGIALVLRRLLYAVAVDEKNLLIAGHPLELLLWLATAAAVAIVIAGVWPLDGSERYADNFPPSVAGAVGAFVLAAGIFLSVVRAGAAVPVVLNRLRGILGYLAAASMVIVGICRIQGRRPFFGFHGLVCVFFAIHMVSHYKTWSGDPQLQDYVFSASACVTLMLFAFYQTAFDVDSGRRRMQLGMGLMTVYLCCAAVYRSAYPLLYLTGGVWAITNLCSFRGVPRQQKENPDDGPGEE